jgi:predicted amidohydrolase
MENFKISTAQFENKSGDKSYNLEVIDKLSQQATSQDAKAISFHEC